MPHWRPNEGMIKDGDAEKVPLGLLLCHSRHCPLA